MHIPDAYLSPVTQAAAFAVMVPLWTIAAKRTAKTLTTRQTPLLSVGAAFAFAIQMFNIPALGGTTAHALGAALLAILVGPWAALLGMSLTLATQALLFGDGGILSLGANSFNMAFVGCFAAYGTFRLLSRGSGIESPRYLISAGVGAFLGTVMASLSAGLMLGIQPAIAHDALGHALYCPFGLSVTLPAMLWTHLLVAGPAEAIITMAALAYVVRSFPAFLTTGKPVRIGSGVRLAGRLAWVLILTPLGLLAAGTAFGEWDVNEVQSLAGYAPAGMSQVQEVIHPLMPDYAISGVEGKPWEVAGYLLSALLGCSLIAAFSWTLLRKRRPIIPAKIPAHRAMGHSIPAWMTETEPPNPIANSTRRRKDPLADILLKAKSTIEEAFVSERTAHQPGFLQTLSPVAKGIAFLGALAAVSLARTPWPPMGILLLSLACAVTSSVPIGPFAKRLLRSVAFFGSALALPVSLQSVTQGPVAFQLGSVAVSITGLNLAALILVRLAASLALAQLWILTTRSHALVRSLRAWHAPQGLVTSILLTYRYLFVFLETLGDMATARTARQVGIVDKGQVRAYAGAGAAILFAKSLALTEELHQAMLARGAAVAIENPPAAPGNMILGATDAV